MLINTITFYNLFQVDTITLGGQQGSDKWNQQTSIVTGDGVV